MDSEDEDYVEDSTAENISQPYRDWIDEIDREGVQMFSMMYFWCDLHCLGPGEKPIFPTIGALMKTEVRTKVILH